MPYPWSYTMSTLGSNLAPSSFRGASIAALDPPSGLFFESWGSGVPVVLVHGSLATGAD